MSIKMTLELEQKLKKISTDLDFGFANVLSTYGALRAVDVDAKEDELLTLIRRTANDINEDIKKTVAIRLREKQRNY